MPAIGRWIARNRRSFAVRKAAGLCRRYLSWFANVSYDAESNGEGFVLATLAGFSPRIVFDAGANAGDWTLLARRHCPSAQIHAFEISPPTFQILSGRLAGEPGVVANNVGLADRDGTVRIRHYDGLEALTTSADYPHPFPYRELDAAVTTGSSYAENKGIAHIDLLKIDVEGMEFPVLRGFEPLFQRRAIDAVQFEYGRVSIVNRFLLRDFHAFFRERGFHVGKIFPNYVDFREYDMADEDFLGPNYLACRAECVEHARAFGGRR